MIKFTKILGVVNVFFDVLMVSLFLSYLLNLGGSGGDTEALGLALASLAFLFIAIILSLPATYIFDKTQIKEYQVLFLHACFVPRFKHSFIDCVASRFLNQFSYNSDESIPS